MSFEFDNHFSLDPVFDSVVALYVYEKMDIDLEVMEELSDSVVLLDFEECAWTRSTVKSGMMKDWHKKNEPFRIKKVRKVRKVCSKGHSLTPENTLRHNGANTCKQCNAAYFQKWKQKQREKRGLGDLLQNRL